MREILFRGKRIDNGEWVEGGLLTDDKKAYIVCDAYGIEAVGFDKETDLCIDQWNEVQSETVCQYTGLTDKNGKKIFEGDIVRDIFNDSVVGRVKYGEYRNTFNDDEFGGHAGFYIEWKEKKDLLRKDIVYWVKNSEFIGNIFDNPDLLTASSTDSD